MSVNPPGPSSTGRSRPSRAKRAQSEPSREADDQPSGLPAYNTGDKRPRELTPPPKLYSLPPDVKQTPRRYKISSMDTYSSMNPQQQQLNNQLARESAGRFLGPMPVQAFLDTFLPEARAPPYPPRKTGFRALFDLPEKEELMYVPFIKAAKEYTGSRLIFRDTHKDPDMHCDGLKPDLSAYDSTEKNMETDTKRTQFSRMDHFLEFKSQKVKDPFYDPPEGEKDSHRFEHDAEYARQSRGQLCSYFAALNRCQFRTHVFSVYIIGKSARFIRWDPTGAVVTAPFTFTNTETMGTFYWRYSHLSRQERGYDPSVRPISEEDMAKIQEKDRIILQDENTFEKRNAKKTKSDTIPKAFYTMDIPDRNNPSIQHPHIISYPPFYQRQSPFGRMTKTMIAFDLERQKHVFVKDYWRSLAPGMEKEGDIYATLEEHNVPNTATFGHGNDVGNASTFNQTLRSSDWACDTHEFENLHLYRMSLLEIGDPVYQFASAKEFLQALRDAMEAHDVAYFAAGILHRDVSVGNVLIHNGRGLLIDWDLCIRMANRREQPRARRADRTGTWQFMSAKILLEPDHLHDVVDDRESAYHLITWLALRYTAHDKLDVLHHYLEHFDHCLVGGDVVTGGGPKKSAFLTSFIPKDVAFKNPKLNPLIMELTRALAVRYMDAPSDEDRKNLEAQEKEIKDLNGEIAEIETQIERISPDITTALERLRNPKFSSDSDMKAMAEEALRTKLEIRETKLDLKDEKVSSLSKSLKARDSNPAFLIPKQLKEIGQRRWLVDFLQRHLTQESWTTNDVATCHYIPPKDLNVVEQVALRESQQNMRLPLSASKRQKMVDGAHATETAGSSGAQELEPIVEA